MNIGMMWVDVTPNKTLATKVQEAAQYFRRKFDRIPELCLFNPKDLKSGELAEEIDVFGEFKVVVRPWGSVLPSHLWIGCEDEAELIPLVDDETEPA